MSAIHIQAQVAKDGEITLNDLPVKAGQQVEVTLEIEDVAPTLTAAELAESDLVGLWEVRTDIQDSIGYARQLREQAQIRE